MGWLASSGLSNTPSSGFPPEGVFFCDTYGNSPLETAFFPPSICLPQINGLRLADVTAHAIRRSQLKGQRLQTSLTIHDSSTAYECVRGVRRGVYVFLGSLFLLLGVIGIVLPGLPTTPFLLLTSYFYARSFPALNRRLLANPVVGPILQNWHQHRGITRRVKGIALTMVLAAMAMLVVLSPLPAMGLLAVLAIAMIGLVVVCRLPVIEA